MTTKLRCKLAYYHTGSCPYYAVVTGHGLLTSMILAATETLAAKGHPGLDHNPTFGLVHTFPAGSTKPFRIRHFRQHPMAWKHRSRQFLPTACSIAANAEALYALFSLTSTFLLPQAGFPTALGSLSQMAQQKLLSGSRQ